MSKRVLLVDDDPVVIRIYRDGLSRQGFEVSTAADGLAALQALHSARPDVVVLDLMMPKLSGAEVLKFMRAEKELQELPVIVLSNAYMDPLARDAAALGAQKGLLKVKCNPASLAAAIHEVLGGEPSRETTNGSLAASNSPRPAATSPLQAAVPLPSQPPKPPAPSQPRGPLTPTSPPKPPPPAPAQPTPEPKEFSNDTRDSARQELFANGVAIGRALGQSFQSFLASRNNMQSGLRLQDFFRKVHFITAMAGMAEHHALAQMASALEALLYGMMDNPMLLEPSLDRTTAMGIEFIQQLLGQPHDSRLAPRPNSWALVVDNDRRANHQIVSALRNAQLQARGTESPETALQWLEAKHYDLVLLQVEMPGMDGIELCKKMRSLPGYEATPVILVYPALDTEFEARARSALSSGDDLIAKPVRPTELAVKAVMHLLRSQSAR